MFVTYGIASNEPKVVFDTKSNAGQPKQYFRENKQEEK